MVHTLILIFNVGTIEASQFTHQHYDEHDDLALVFVIPGSLIILLLVGHIIPIAIMMTNIDYMIWSIQYGPYHGKPLIDNQFEQLRYTRYQNLYTLTIYFYFKLPSFIAYCYEGSRGTFRFKSRTKNKYFTSDDIGCRNYSRLSKVSSGESFARIYATEV